MVAKAAGGKRLRAKVLRQFRAGLPATEGEPSPQRAGVPPAKGLELQRTADGEHLLIQNPPGPGVRFPHRIWWGSSLQTSQSSARLYTAGAAWKGRPGAEAAAVSRGTTVPLSHPQKYAPPPSADTQHHVLPTTAPLPPNKKAFPPWLGAPNAHQFIPKPSNQCSRPEVPARPLPQTLTPSTPFKRMPGAHLEPPPSSHSPIHRSGPGRKGNASEPSMATWTLSRGWPP